MVYGKGKLTADGLWTTVERLVEDCGLMDYGLRTTVYSLQSTDYGREGLQLMAYGLRSTVRGSLQLMAYGLRSTEYSGQ